MMNSAFPSPQPGHQLPKSNFGQCGIRPRAAALSLGQHLPRVHCCDEAALGVKGHTKSCTHCVTTCGPPGPSLAPWAQPASPGQSSQLGERGGRKPTVLFPALAFGHNSSCTAAKGLLKSSQRRQNLLLCYISISFPPRGEKKQFGSTYPHPFPIKSESHSL